MVLEKIHDVANVYFTNQKSAADKPIYGLTDRPPCERLSHQKSLINRQADNQTGTTVTTTTPRKNLKVGLHFESVTRMYASSNP